MICTLIITKRYVRINEKKKFKFDKNTGFGDLMKLIDINPYVRFARIHKKQISRAPIVGLDHRLFYSASGEVHINADGKEYSISEGDLLFIRAGVAYSGSAESAGSTLLAYNFDMLFDDTHPVAPVSYRLAEDYSNTFLIEPDFDPECEIFDRVICVRRFFKKERFDEIISEYSGGRDLHAERCGALMKDILILLSREGRTSTAVGKSEHILAYLRKHYREPLTNELVAERFSYHKNYVNQILRSEVGTTLHSYLLNYRITVAVRLIASGEYTVAEVAEQVGFSDLAHFSRAFKKIIGKPPTEYKPKRKG
jgi:AraC-like DNA-binding protein